MLLQYGQQRPLQMYELVLAAGQHAVRSPSADPQLLGSSPASAGATSFASNGITAAVNAAGELPAPIASLKLGHTHTPGSCCRAHDASLLKLCWSERLRRGCTCQEFCKELRCCCSQKLTPRRSCRQWRWMCACRPCIPSWQPSCNLWLQATALFSQASQLTRHL